LFREWEAIVQGGASCQSWKFGLHEQILSVPPASVLSHRPSRITKRPQHTVKTFFHGLRGSLGGKKCSYSQFGTPEISRPGPQLDVGRRGWADYGPGFLLQMAFGLTRLGTSKKAMFSDSDKSPCVACRSSEDHAMVVENGSTHDAWFKMFRHCRARHTRSGLAAGFWNPVGNSFRLILPGVPSVIVHVLGSFTAFCLEESVRVESSLSLGCSLLWSVSCRATSVLEAPRS